MPLWGPRFSVKELMLAPYYRYKRHFPPAFEGPDPSFPDKRWHQVMINFVLDTFRGYEPRRPWDDGTMFPNWNHVWRLDWLVALYHGYWLRKWTHTWENQKIRIGVRSDSPELFCVKYAKAPKKYRPSNEVYFLRRLSQPDMDDPRNHTAFASEIFWFDKIVVTPWYHSASSVFWRPNDVIELAKQYFEGLAFFHEHNIAHLDAGIHNIVIAIHPMLDKPRYMFIDFELAQECYPGERVDLWWLDTGKPVTFPPEGLRDIDPFPFDILRAGRLFMELLDVYFDKQTDVWQGLQWPHGFREAFEPMTHQNPTLRPTAQFISKILPQICTKLIDHPSYEERTDTWWMGQLKGSHPSRRYETALPVRRTL